MSSISIVDIYRASEASREKELKDLQRINQLNQELLSKASGRTEISKTEIDEIVRSVGGETDPVIIDWKKRIETPATEAEIQTKINETDPGTNTNLNPTEDQSKVEVKTNFTKQFEGLSFMAGGKKEDGKYSYISISGKASFTNGPNSQTQEVDLSQFPFIEGQPQGLITLDKATTKVDEQNKSILEINQGQNPLTGEEMILILKPGENPGDLPQLSQTLKPATTNTETETAPPTN